MLMRLEKGFLHVGSDTDGTSIPDDVGWGKVAANKKGDHIGKRSLKLPEHLRSDRLQLVGLSATPESRFVVGSHLRVMGSTEPTDGWITSAGTSVMTHEPIALAMLHGGRARIGTEVEVYDLGARVGKARVFRSGYPYLRRRGWMGRHCPPFVVFGKNHPRTPASG
jgi:sarcosine oxidase subunit alpha